MKFLVWEARIYDMPDERKRYRDRAQLIEDSSPEEAVREFSYTIFRHVEHIDMLTNEGGVMVQAQGERPVRYDVKAIETVEFKVKKATP